MCAALIGCGGDDKGDASPDGGDDGGAGSGNAGNGGTGGTAGDGSGGDGTGPDGGPAEEVDPDFEGIPMLEATAAPSGCVGATVSEDTLLLQLGGELKELVLASKGGVLQANGVACDSPANPKRIRIVGSAADETVVVDYSFGLFPDSLRMGSIAISLGGGQDTVAVAATRESDDIVFGHMSDADLGLVNSWPLLRLTDHELLIVSAGPDGDEVDASGRVEFSGALRAPLRVYGGAGNDTLQGGAEADELHAGGGDDVFKTAAEADGADSYDGAGGEDVLSYEKRTAGVEITVDGEANDGASDEGDNVLPSVEGLTGGEGDDEISAGDADNTLIGGPGDDVLNGGAGQDLFFELARAGSDVVNGGPGTDSVDYSGRKLALDVTLCTAPETCLTGACECEADDGEENENDTLVNVENVTAGSGNDRLIGSDADNFFRGGAGKDELRGEAGDDYLYGEGGDDTLVGGTGEDLLDGEQGRDSFDGGDGQGDICLRSGTETMLQCELSI